MARKKEMAFEEALGALEQIVAEIEAGDLALADLMASTPKESSSRSSVPRRCGARRRRWIFSCGRPRTASHKNR